MGRTVSRAEAAVSGEWVLPAVVQEALGQLVGVAREGLLALSVGVGLGVLCELMVECPRFGGHLSAWSAVSGWAGRMGRSAKGLEPSEAVSAGVSA